MQITDQVSKQEAKLQKLESQNLKEVGKQRKVEQLCRATAQICFLISVHRHWNAF